MNKQKYLLNPQTRYSRVNNYVITFFKITAGNFYLFRVIILTEKVNQIILEVVMNLASQIF